MRIMPSGNGAFDWVPRGTGLNKQASNKDGKVQEESYRDDLLEAAKKVVANYECAGEFGGNEFEAPDSDAVEFDGEEVSEVSEEGKSPVVEGLERAVDAIEDAVKELGGDPDAAEDVSVNEEFEFEIENEEPVEEEVVEVSIDDDDDDDEEECDEDEEECDDEDEVVEAKSNDWVKIAEISPQNRKKIMDYWSNKLGYPKDFVKLMVKDYEK